MSEATATQGEESATTESEETSVPRKVLRTVTPYNAGHPDSEMNAIGWTVFLGLVVLLVPLLPFIALVWLISKGIETVQARRG